MVEAVSDKFICIVDESKLSKGVMIMMMYVWDDGDDDGDVWDDYVDDDDDDDVWVDGGDLYACYDSDISFYFSYSISQLSPLSSSTL
jgi:hypothetical protein